MQDVAFQTLLRLGDNALVLGHRVSEWCGHSPMLEEDIALANVALDLIGQATNWLTLAGDVEGAGRSADDLAMLRDAWDFRNALLVEQTNGDFGKTIMRQALFDQFHKLQLQALLGSSDPRIAEIAAKGIKEVTYHAERSADLVVRLGDGTEESHTRMQNALDLLFPFVGELLTSDSVDLAADQAGLAPKPETLADAYNQALSQVMRAATLAIPDHGFMHTGGKSGKMHSEHLGHMLAVMQSVQRAHPGAVW